MQCSDVCFRSPDAEPGADRHHRPPAMARRLLLGAAIGAPAATIAALHTCIVQVPVPDASLLARDAAHRASLDPAYRSYADAFRVRVRTRRRPSIDQCLQAFIESPVFTLERRLHVWNGLARPDPTGRSTFDVGSVVSLWTVVHKTDRAVLLRWGHPSLTLRGSTFLQATRVDGDDDAHAIDVVFGSGLDLPASLDDTSLGWRAASAAHRLFSRVLLASTVLQMKYHGVI